MSLPIVKIVVDGGPGLGFGHLSRTATLAEALHAEGLGVQWEPLSALAAEHCAKRDFDMGDIALVLIDLPYAEDGPVIEAQSLNLPTLGLDYLGQAGPDVLIRMNAPLTPIPAGRTAFGLEYAIIRQDIRKLETEPGDYVLVQIGGSDHGDLGPKAAHKLTDQGERAILVRGPIARDYDFSGVPYEVRHTPDNLPQLMAGCRFAVTNGGTTMVELMSLSKGVHAIAQTDEEARFITPLYEDGILLGMGLESLRSYKDNQIRNVGRNAGSCVDGRGAERIAKVARELIEGAKR